MGTRPTSRKDSPSNQSSEKPFVDLAAENERELAKVAEKIIAEAKRDGKVIAPPKYDRAEEEENERILRKLFGEPIAKKR